MSLHKHNSPDARAWGYFLDGFDPFIYLRLAEAVAHPAVRKDFEEAYPGHAFSDEHSAVAIHAYRMMAAEALFLVLLQVRSGKNILQFMAWCKNQRFREAITCLSKREHPLSWPTNIPLVALLRESLTCGRDLKDQSGLEICPDPEELLHFISTECDGYLRTEPFNSIKHGGRFSSGFPELSVEIKPGEWRKMISAPQGITSYSYKEADNHAVVQSYSLELDADNDLERLRGITSLLDKAKAARILHLGHRQESEAWNYELVDASFRQMLNWTQKFKL